MKPCPICVALYKTDPTIHINYIGQDQDSCRYHNPDYNPEKSRLKKELDKKVKQALGRQEYNHAHPLVKIPVNGTWKKVPRS